MTEDSFDDRLMWLLKTNRTMLATRDMERLLAFITRSFIEFTQAERAVLLLKDRETGLLLQSFSQDAAGNTLKDVEKRVTSMATRTLKEKRPVFSAENAPTEEGASKRPATETVGQKMTIFLPLLTETESLGVLFADGKPQVADLFSNAHRRMIEMFADYAAATIENARLFERATNDPLTGLPNNSYFLFQLTKAMKDASTGRQTGILLLDVDAFKRVNYAAGAEMGDRALVDIANTLQDVLKADGLVARYGSDKFGILLPPDDAAPISIRLRDCAERARAAIGTKVYHGVQMSACIGGIGFPGAEAKTPGDLVALADDVLARARTRGPGEVEIA